MAYNKRRGDRCEAFRRQLVQDFVKTLSRLLRQAGVQHQIWQYIHKGLSRTLYHVYSCCTIQMHSNLHYRNTISAFLKCTSQTICTICAIEGLGLGELGASQGWGNQLEDVRGTSTGNIHQLTYKTGVRSLLGQA